MERHLEFGLDRKHVFGMVLICLALGAVFAVAYLDLKTDYASLRDDYETLSARMEQLQSTLEALHYNQTASLPAVQIYNNSKYSVVLITNTRKDQTVVEGSGFVYTAQGHIITNNHVVDQTESLSVTFLDGTVEEAQLVGTDVYSDLAVVKVETLPSNAQPLLLANSTQLLVGEPVYAIGNPFRLSGSMTAGIVSQLGRVLRLADMGVPPPWGNYSIVDVIQSDVAINPGNSGGPLLNSLGEVVGVTFAIETADNSSGFIGIGYAVPSVLLERVIPSLINAPTHAYAHPWIGIEFTDMTLELAETLHSDYTKGALIVTVIDGSPAETADLRANDTIIDVDGVSIGDGDALLIYLERYKSPDDVITLTIVRNNEVLYVNLTLGERPSD